MMLWRNWYCLQYCEIKTQRSEKTNCKKKKKRKEKNERDSEMEMKKLRKYKKNNAGIWKMWEEKSKMEKTKKKNPTKKNKQQAEKNSPKALRPCVLTMSPAGCIVTWSRGNELAKWRCIAEQQMVTFRGRIGFSLSVVTVQTHTTGNTQTQIVKRLEHFH